MTEQNTNTDSHKEVVRYKWEYAKFLEFVKKGKVQRAIIYAKALQIDRKTFVHWLSQPELMNAMQESIDQLVDGMQRAGKDDWRMYREMLKLIGVDDESKIDITSDGEPINVIIESSYGNKPNFRPDNSATETSEMAEDRS